MLPKIQYITQNDSNSSHYEQAIKMYEAGCKWVQLRMKDETKETILNEALKIATYAQKNQVILTINDHVDITQASGANGVHLGKNDSDIKLAIKHFSTQKIIGATANTFADIKNALNKGADYIGLGPYRYTSTKKILSPVLGLGGYERIINKLPTLKKNIPIYAIGGIKMKDMEQLKNIGVYGIAVSGMLLNSTQKETDIKEIHRIFV